MNRFASAFVLLSVTLAFAGCKKKSDEPAAGSGSGTATAVAAAPDAAAPAPAVDAAAAAAPAVTLTAGAIGGPFASVEAYCTDVSKAFTKDRCWSEGDQIEMCSCEAADKDDLAGNVKAGGTSTNLKGALLVSVADVAADYAHCSLALQLAGGWHIVHKAFPCGAAPVSHDGGLDVTVNSFNILDDKLTLAYTTDDGQKKTAYTLACTATAADQASCTPPAAKK